MRRAASNPGLPLVEWPAPGEGWVDTGEGGLFAYAFWEHQSGWDRCVVERLVDVLPWDVMVDAVGPMGPDFVVVDRAGERDADGMPVVSGLDVGVAVYLGSSPYSSQASDRYFRVSSSVLTSQGAGAVGALEAVFGEATFVTFLDT